jgi:uncharacterized protein (DUF885 family)
MKSAAMVLLTLAAASAAAAASAPQGAEAGFIALYQQEYAWRLGFEGPGSEAPEANPFLLPDVGPEAQVERLKRWTAVMGELEKIDPAQLPPGARVDYRVYRGQVASLLDAQRFRDYEMPANSDTQFWTDVSDLAHRTLRSEQDCRAYVAMLAQVPRYFDQQVANMRAGLARGFTPPRVTLAGRDAGVAAVAAVQDARESLYYLPLRTLPSGMAAATAEDLRAQALRAIREQVLPAYARLLRFLREEYIPGARASLAASELPDGAAWYRSQIRRYVTQDADPAAVHALGLAEVQHIEARMRETMRAAGFRGTLPQFLRFLRSDPRFYAKDPQRLLERAAWIAKRFDDVAPRWFGHLPRQRFGIRPVPAELAPFYTGGRGGPGVYLLNTWHLSTRPLYSLTALTLHESAPGHAFQGSLSLENQALPAFRRNSYLSAYGEGWALYCEALGEDMGLYDTPYETFGMLSYQMWRAARLVVDTGIHSMGWTREAARAYMHAHTALSDHEIATEVDRYISWPGQALSYYMGERAFLAARERARSALGPQFNIRAFHDAMLALGSVPLDVIAERTDEFIAAGGAGPYPDEER